MVLYRKFLKKGANKFISYEYNLSAYIGENMSDIRYKEWINKDCKVSQTLKLFIEL